MIGYDAVTQEPVHIPTPYTREYWATHAPIEIPDWFMFNDDIENPVQPVVSPGTPIEEIRKMAKDYNVACRVAESKRRSTRFFQWRWYYADQMLQHAKE